MSIIPRWLQERRKSSPGYAEFSRLRTDDLDSNPLLSDIAFNRHSKEQGDHVSPLDNGVVQIGLDGITVRLVQGLDEKQLRKTLSKTLTATVGNDVAAEPAHDFRKPSGELHGRCLKCSVLDYSVEAFEPCYGDWEEMLKGGLQTALETQVIVFEVSGVSRTCTHQLVRSRRASFHQQSQRASYMGDRPDVRMPESVWRNPRARQAFLAAVDASHDAYRIACEEDISYQDARFALLEGTNTYILLEYSLREFINVYAYRACYMFQWEISHVMHECRAALIESHPWLAQYVKISCEKTGGGSTKTDVQINGNPVVQMLPHKCTFQGWESVEGQCPFPWAKEDNRTFQPKAHRIGR